MAAPVSRAAKNTEEYNSVLKDVGPDKLIVVFYYAEWSGPCLRLLSIFEGFAKLYREDVVCVRIDFDDADNALTKGIVSVPTFKYYRGGVCVDSMYVNIDQAQLEGRILKYRPTRNTRSSRGKDAIPQPYLDPSSSSSDTESAIVEVATEDKTLQGTDASGSVNDGVGAMRVNEGMVEEVAGDVDGPLPEGEE